MEKNTTERGEIRARVISPSTQKTKRPFCNLKALDSFFFVIIECESHFVVPFIVRFFGLYRSFISFFSLFLLCWLIGTLLSLVVPLFRSSRPVDIVTVCIVLSARARTRQVIALEEEYNCCVPRIITTHFIPSQ